MFREVSRDKRQILSEDKCIEILKDASSGVLSVFGDDGYPYGVPMSFAYDDNKLYFHCMPHGHKFDAINKNGNVCFTVIEKDSVVPQEYTTYFRSVIVFGKARMITDLDEKIGVTDRLVKKYSPNYIEGYLEKFRARIKMMGAFVVEADHISGKEAIELAAPGWNIDDHVNDEL